MSPRSVVFWPLLVFLGYYLQGATSQSDACTQANRNSNLQACLTAIRQRAEDSSYFWFGDSYSTRCPNPTDRMTIDCFSAHMTAKSLSSALFNVDDTDLSVLDRYIAVTYTSAPGSYTGCDYAYNNTMTEQFSLDPLSNSTFLPWDLRTLPEVTWTASSGDLFTLMMFDAGFGVLHAFYVNIPGTNISQADTVFAYRGAGNFRDVPNPYVYVLYKQSGAVTASSITLTLIAPQNVAQINITEYVETYQLGDLVGMTWLLASYDAYSVQGQTDSGSLENCASLVKNALTNSSQHQRSFLPSSPDLSVVLRLKITSDAITYPCGNESRSQVAADFYVDPLGTPIVNTATARAESTQIYSMKMNKVAPNNTIDFVGKMYSLLYVDPDIPPSYAMIGNSDRPYLHGLTINIPGTDVASGTTLASYRGPAPPDGPHYYYFLLYEQPATLQMTNTNGYTESQNCPSMVAGRCLFNVTSFVSSNNLTLVGATWFKATTDDYVTCSSLPSNGSGRPTGSPASLTILGTLALVVVTYIK